VPRSANRTQACNPLWLHHLDLGALNRLDVWPCNRDQNRTGGDEIVRIALAKAFISSA